MTTKTDQLLGAGVDARHAAHNRRAKRRKRTKAVGADAADVADQANSEVRSPAAQRRRCRELPKEDSDDHLVALVENVAEIRRGAQRRRFAAEEERLEKSEGRLRLEQDMDRAQRAQAAACSGSQV